MKSFAGLLVRHRIRIFTVTCLVALICALMILRVPILTDMTRYLPDGSPMKAGVDIMAEEFSGLSLSNTIRVMFTGLEEPEKASVLDRLRHLSHVDSVSYVPGDPHYEKDDYALYTLNFSCDYGSREELAIEKALRSDFSDLGQMTFTVDDTTGGDVPLVLMAAAVVMIITILTVIGHSWLEPYLFLIAIGLAVAINMGTNLFLGGISDITLSIAAILQLVLSLDYSIILMNRYRQELRVRDVPEDAMIRAITASFSSVSSSSLTTVVGLLALLFMGFKIGGEMGFVLAKGVLISMICIFTALPALILFCDPLLRKTVKRSPDFSMRRHARAQYRLRLPILVGFCLLFLVMFLEKDHAGITFTLSEPSLIDDIFPKTNQIVVLYENQDDPAAGELCSLLEQEPCVESVNAYVNTLGKPLTAEELTDALPQLLSGLSSAADMDTFGPLAGLSEGGEADSFLRLASLLLRLVYWERAAGTDDITTRQSAAQILDVASEDLLNNPIIARLLPEEDAVSAKLALTAARPLLGAFSGNRELTEDEFANRAGALSEALDENTLRLLFRVSAAKNSPLQQTAMSMVSLAGFAGDLLRDDPLYSALIDEDTIDSVSALPNLLDSLTAQLRSENHSIIAIFADLPDGGGEAFAFMDRLEAKCKDLFAGNTYLIGNTPLAWETSLTFREEMNKITLITAAAIFLVVLITFRNLLIPAILVLLIQTSVYITMVVISLQGEGIYYLALLMVQSILMGATIDYAILLTNYYRELRRENDIPQALAEALRRSMHTILSSGLIIVLITIILGYAFPNPTIGQICHTIAKGAAAAMILVLMVLPGVLGALDRWIVPVFTTPAGRSSPPESSGR